MARDRSGFGNEEDNDLSLLRDYSKSLGRSADALLSSAKEFSKSSSSLESGMSRSLSRLERALEQTAKNFESTEESSGKSRDQIDSKHLEKMERVLTEQQVSRDQSVKQFSNTTSAFVKSFSQVATYAINKLTTGFNTVVSSFEDNLTSVTVRMQKTNREYTTMLNSVTNKIRDERLNTQFSQTDYLDQLSRVLDTGIRSLGDKDTTAEDMAYRNMITSKLLPSINTNTRAYTRMSKLLGDEFSKSVVAIGKYTEQIYGMEGFDEGQFDAKLEQFKYSLLADATTKDQGLSNLENFTAFYQKVAAEYGQETAETISSQIIDSYYGMPGSNVQMAVAGYGTPGAISSLINSNAEGWDTFLQRYTDQYRSMDRNSPTLRSVLGNTLSGYDSQVAESIRIKDRYGKSYADISSAMEGYNADRVYEEQVSRLQSGDYQSKTAQQQKWNENAVAKLANKAAEILPDATGTLGLIWSLLGTWFLLWKVGAGGGNGSSLGSRLSGMKGKASSLGDSLSGTFSEPVGSKLLPHFGAGEVATGLNATALGALGVSEILGGGVAVGSGIKDIIDDSVMNKAETGGGQIAGGLAGLAGGGLGVAAALGAVSGPIGWIGLAVGGVGLLGAAVADATKQVNSFSGSIEESSSQVQEEIASEKLNYERQITQIKKNYAQGEAQRDQLKKLGLVEEDLIDQYGITADQMLEYTDKFLSYQSQFAEKYYGRAQTEAISEFAEKRDDIAGAFAYSDMSDAEFEALMKASASLIGDEGKRKEFLEGLLEFKEGGYDVNEREALVGVKNQGGLTSLFSKYDYDSNLLNNVSDLSGFNDLMRAKQFDESLLLTETEKASSIAGNESLQALVSDISTYNSSTVQGIKEQAKINAEKILNDETFKNYFIENKDKIDETSLIQDFARSSGIEGYKLGLGNVPYDDMLVRLHQGEMVLTSAQAGYLRSVADGSVSGFLKGLFFNHNSQSSAEVVPQDSESVNMTSLIVDTIKSQTVEIVGVLNSILEVVSKGQSVSASNSSKFPDGLVSFQGY